MNRMLKGIVPLAFIAFLAREVSAQEDPGATGPLPTTSTEYSADNILLVGGDPIVLEVEVLAKVHRPTSLSNGPYPLVLFLHGQHVPCYVVLTQAGSNDWPCTASGLAPVPSYRGYDYVAATLASHGMIVVSISANAINAVDETHGGLRIDERRQLVQHHINKWVTFNSTGDAPFGTTFVGKVDFQRIATVGHSRGGQAVLNHAVQTPPAGLRAVMAIAPTNDKLFTPLSNVPLTILTGYCDQDQEQLQGVGYVDQARYAVATDHANKYTVLGLGANHNYFNSVWGPSFPTGKDDWTKTTDPHCGTNSNARLSELEQQGFGRAYIAAFLRKHLLGATQFDSILNGDALAPPSAQTTDVFVGYLPSAGDRKDLNRLSTSAESTTNTLGGGVTTSGLTATPCSSSPRCVTSNRSTHWPSSGGLPGVLIEWNASGGTYSNALPVFKRDVSNFATLQSRVAVDYTDSDNTVGQAQDFSIRLTDVKGSSSTLRASDYSDVLYYPPGAVGTGTANGRAAVMNTLRVPIEAFANVDLTNIASLVLIFDRTPKGRVVLSDITFAEESTTVAEEWLIADSLAAAP